jgi:CTP synthase
MKFEDDVLFVHVGYLPVPEHLGEMKTKPIQHSIKSLQALGIHPDFIIGRAKYKLDIIRKKKIALSCSLAEDRILSVPDVEIIYSIPVILQEQKLAEKILNAFGLSYIVDDEGFKKWKIFIENIKSFKDELKIGIVGKYFDIGDFNLVDAYISVIEAVKHACWNNGHKAKIIWLDSKTFEDEEDSLTKLKEYDGIIVPGGFGASGVEGKINAIKFVRENDIPFLGLCYGMQLAVIEWARNKCGMINANSSEIDSKTKHAVIDILPEQKEIIEKSRYGASMRLGAYPAILKEDTQIYKLYGKREISERHRHRYEVNPEYIGIIEDTGLVFSGVSPDRRLMEFMELPNHPYFVGTQAHPEFKSRPMHPAPLFDGLIKAIVQKKKFLQKRLPLSGGTSSRDTLETS